MSQGSCDVPAPLTQYQNPGFSLVNSTALCSNNRSGILCSRCVAGYTATVNERGCIPNDECRNRLAWIWTVVIFSYLLYGLYIAFSCLNDRSGIMTALICFGQMSQFALPRIIDSSQNPSSALANAAQFESLISVFSGACLATDISTFTVVLFKLCGPAFVFIFALAWAGILKLYQRWSRTVHLNRTISYVGTSAHCLVFIFSSLSAIISQLIQCVEVQGVGRVFYLDSSRSCYDGVWIVLLCAMLCLVFIPIWFTYALFSSKLPIAARYAICNSYTDNMYFWAAVSLAFRMFMSISYSFIENSSVGHSVLLMMSVVMVVLLVHFKPYKDPIAQRVDLICHVCLIAQFCCSILEDAIDSVGVSYSSTGDCYFIVWILVSNLDSFLTSHRVVHECRGVCCECWQCVPLFAVHCGSIRHSVSKTLINYNVAQPHPCVLEHLSAPPPLFIGCTPIEFGILFNPFLSQH
jgi:hypothetical protein